MYYDESSIFNKLQKIYNNKCGQVKKAKQSSNLLRYQVLKAEAEAIRIELGQLADNV